MAQPHAHLCAGTNNKLLHLTTVLGIDENGYSMPIAYLLHEFQDAAVVTAFLDGLAHHILESDLPDYMETAPAHPVVTPPGSPAPGAPSTAAPSPGSGGPPRRQCLPSKIVIDTSSMEKSAVEASLWGQGWVGDVDGVPKFRWREHTTIAFCFWHLVMAWVRKANEVCPEPRFRKAMVASLRKIAKGAKKEARQGGVHRCAHHLTLPTARLRLSTRRWRPSTKSTARTESARPSSITSATTTRARSAPGSAASCWATSRGRSGSPPARRRPSRTTPT